MQVGDRIRLPSGDYFGTISSIETMGVFVSFPFHKSEDKGPFVWRFHPGSWQMGNQLIVSSVLAGYLKVPAGSVLQVVPADTVIPKPAQGGLESPMQRAFRIANG
jgi:hypothetical protein